MKMAVAKLIAIFHAITQSHARQVWHFEKETLNNILGSRTIVLPLTILIAEGH